MLDSWLSRVGTVITTWIRETAGAAAGGVVGIEDGRIEFVEPAGSEAPAARRTIDGTGSYVLPGDRGYTWACGA